MGFDGDIEINTLLLMINNFHIEYMFYALFNREPCSEVILV